MFKFIYNNIRYSVYPTSCAVCSRFVNNSIICPDCLVKLKHCHYNGVINLYHTTSLFNCYAVYRYKHKEVGKIVISMKRHYNKELFEFCAKEISALIQKTLPDYSKFTVVHIPTRKSAAAIRGFDQGKILAQNVSKQLGINYSPLLIRKGKSKEQKNLNLAQRQENVRGIFRINKNMSVCENIILIDDVCTTGSTASECISVLRKAGCRNIVCYFVSTVN